MSVSSSSTASPTIDRDEGAGSPRLIEKLESTHQEIRQFLLLRCLIWLGLVELTLAASVALADWLWVLSGPVRLACLIALAGAGLGVVYRSFIATGVAQRKLRGTDIGLSHVAAEVETGFPELGQRVRTTVEYNEPSSTTSTASPALVQALTAETELRTRSLRFSSIIPWRAIRWPGIGLASALFVVIVFLATHTELRTAALRLFLWPAHYTQLTVAPGDHTVKAAIDVTIQATLTGRPVNSAEVQYRTAGDSSSDLSVSARWMVRALTDKSELKSEVEAPRKLIGTLETTFNNCQTDLEYRVVAGPIESPTYRLHVLHPLELKKVEARIEPPAYTRKPPAMVNEGNFKVIEGSKVQFRFVLDRSPKTARLLANPAAGLSRGKTSEVSETSEVWHSALVLNIEGDTLTGALPSVKEELEYEVFAEAEDGMRLEAGPYRIQVQPDRPPTIRFLKPEEQIEVTPTTEVNMRLEARDDFGLAKVGIIYQIGNGPKKTLFLKEDPAQPPGLAIKETLPLETQALSFQDSVTYYAFAEDNHPAHPHRSRTELQFIDIRPFKRSYQLLKTGGS